MVYAKQTWANGGPGALSGARLNHMEDGIEAAAAAADQSSPAILVATTVNGPTNSSATAEELAAADYVCDGTADDVQIQAAINALTEGGEIVFSSGYYNWAAAATVDWPAGNFQWTLRAKNRGLQDRYWGVPEVGFRRPASTTADMFDLSAEDPFVTFEGIHFSSVDATSTASHFIVGTGYLNFRQCAIYNRATGNHPAIVATSCDSVQFIDCFLVGQSQAILSLTGSYSTVRIEDCYVGAWTSAPPTSTALFVLDGEGAAHGDADMYLQMRGCHSDGNSFPLLHVKGFGAHQHISNNTFAYDNDRAFYHILLEDSQKSIIANNISGAIKLDGCRRVLLTNNLVEEPGNHGIWLLDSSNCLVQGNLVDSPGSLGASTYSGILIDGNSDQNNVQMNTVRAGTSTPLYYIRIDDATCNDNLVTNNDVDGGTVSDAGTSTVTTAGNRT